MPGPELFNDTMFAYQRVMDFRTQRHNVVSSNLSNAETPGYEAKDVQFENILKEAITTEKGFPLVRTNSKHIDQGGQIEILSTRPQIVKVKSPKHTKSDGYRSADRVRRHADMQNML